MDIILCTLLLLTIKDYTGANYLRDSLSTALMVEMVSSKILVDCKLYLNSFNNIKNIVVNGRRLYCCNLSGDNIVFLNCTSGITKKLEDFKLCSNYSNNINDVVGDGPRLCDCNLSGMIIVFISCWSGINKNAN